MAEKSPIEEKLEKLNIHEHTEHCKHEPHERPPGAEDDNDDEDEEDWMNFLLRQQQQQQHQHSHGHQHSECCSQDHHGDEYFNQYYSPPPNKFSDKSKFFVPDEQEINGILYTSYKHERQLKMVMEVISRDLSEPYSIYTYRYFIYNWPNLCFLVGKIKAIRKNKPIIV
jgi:hypothetical protein